MSSVPAKLLQTLQQHHQHRLLACLQLLVKLGVPRENIWVTDLAGVVYEGRVELMDPDKAVFAHEYLLKVATLGQRIDAVIDERLELARLHLGRGNLERVLAECAAIQDKVSDVVDSLIAQAQAETFRRILALDIPDDAKRLIRELQDEA